MNGEQRADFTDAVIVIEHQPTTLGKMRHHIMKDIVDLRMLCPFSLARARSPSDGYSPGAYPTGRIDLVQVVVQVDLSCFYHL